MVSLHRSRSPSIRQIAVGFAVLDLAIVVGLGFLLLGGPAIGTALTANGGTDPVKLLGTDLGETTCPSAPLAVGDGMTVICPDWSAVTTSDGVVKVVSLYGPGNSTIDQYRGGLPMGLAWGTSLTDVVAKIGSPSRITGAYGTPTLVYAYEGMPYGSLELRFNAGNRLVRVNACLLR